MTEVLFDDYVSAYQNAIGTETGTELWVSGLIRKDMNNMEPIFMAFHDNGIDWCEPCSSNKLAFGYFGTDSDVNGVKMWSIKLGTTVYPTAIPLIVGTTAFFAAKISLYLHRNKRRLLCKSCNIRKFTT